MIHQRVYFEREDWVIHCFLDVRKRDVPAILTLLSSLNLLDDEAAESLERNDFNSGLTISDLLRQESVIVAAHTTSAKQMVNTFTHEIRHLTDHIALAHGIPQSGEPIAYLTGDISMALAGSLLQLVCDCPHCNR